jgi:hypothetical protein
MIKRFIFAFTIFSMLVTTASAATFRVDVTPVVPEDIVGGAVDADIDDAGKFAWEQFIALHWPADTTGGQRDVADEGATFGDPDYTGPLVWHTYRHKAEIFPGSGEPTGLDYTADDFGYSTLPPVYRYEPDVGTDGVVPACPDQTPVTEPALINLDENTQIGIDYMFAGAAPDDIDPDTNALPQLIRFLAQGNQTYFKYVVDPDSLVTGGDPLYTHPRSCPSSEPDPETDPDGYADYNHTYCEAKRNFTAVAQGNGTPDTIDGISVNFKAGTILVKGGFRELTDTEAASGRFYKTTVRYYEDIPGGDDEHCYFERVWGMVALHIIHRTPTAPAFVFSTFEHVDNLLTADGDLVENEDGRFMDDGDEEGSTTPAVIYEDGDPPTLTIDGDDTVFEDYCQDIGKRLYYLENPGRDALPNDGLICQNFRDYSIPAHIRRVNRSAHAAIEKYTENRGIANTPFKYYRLVNVQAEPFDKSEISTVRTHDNRSKAVFYLSNSVVETDYSLQNFSGRLTGGLTSDQPANFDGFDPQRDTYQNVLSFDGNQLQKTSNMGGCMGCHGVAQGGGNDFSFVLGGGRVKEPEAPDITLPGTSNPPPGDPPPDDP